MHVAIELLQIQNVRQRLDEILMSIDIPSPSSLRYIYSSIKARQCLNMLRVFGFSFDDVYTYIVYTVILRPIMDVIICMRTLDLIRSIVILVVRTQ